MKVTQTLSMIFIVVSMNTYGNQIEIKEVQEQNMDNTQTNSSNSLRQNKKNATPIYKDYNSSSSNSRIYNLPAIQKALAWAGLGSISYGTIGYYSALKNRNNTPEINDQLWYNIGLAKINERKFEEAIEILEELQNVEILRDQNIYNNLGYAHYMKSRNHKKSMPSYDKALEYFKLGKEKGDKLAEYNLMALSATLGRNIEKGIYESFSLSNNLYQNSLNQYFNLKNQSYKKEKHHLTNEQIPIDDKTSSINYAYALIEEGNTIDAIKFLHGLIKQHNGFQPAYHALGIAYEKQNDLYEAKRWFCCSNRIKESYIAHYGLGMILLKEKSFDLAELHFSKSLKLNDQFASPYLGLGKIEYMKAMQKKHRSLGEQQKYTRDYSEKSFIHLTKYKNLALYPDSSNYREFEKIYAYVSLRVGYYSIAKEYFQKLITYPQYKPDGVLGLGIILFKLGIYEESEKLLTEALKFDKEFRITANHYLGHIEFEKENYDLSKKYYYNSLSEGSSDSTEIALGLGNTYLKEHNYKQAEKYYSMLQDKNEDWRVLNNKSIVGFYNLEALLAQNKDTVAYKQNINQYTELLHRVIDRKVSREDSIYTFYSWLNLIRILSMPKFSDEAKQELAKMTTKINESREFYSSILFGFTLNNIGVSLAREPRISKKTVDSCFQKAITLCSLYGKELPRHNLNIFAGNSSKLTFFGKKKNQTYNDKYVSIMFFIHENPRENPLFNDLNIEPIYETDYKCLPNFDYIIIEDPLLSLKSED